MPTNTHISYLDTIRGLAALAVISEHFVIAYGLPCQSEACNYWLDFSPLHIWWDGAAAVSMFFVLSGLVLSIKYFRDGHRPDLSRFHLAQFLIGRMFRIWMPYLLVLLISAALFVQHFQRAFPASILPASDWITGMWHDYPLGLRDMLRESFLLKMPSLIVLLPQAWTLGIELIISLLLPVGLLLADRGTSWLLFFGLLSTSLLGVPIFLWHFVLGLLLARHYDRIHGYLEARNWQRRLLLLAGLLLYTIDTLLPEELVGGDTLWLGSGLGSGMILMFVLSSQHTQRWLSYALLRQIGKVSYSAYLTHMAVLLCLTPYLLQTLEVWTADPLALWFGGWLLTIVAVQLLSLLFYHALELPSMALGKRLAEACKRLG